MNLIIKWRQFKMIVATMMNSRTAFPLSKRFGGISIRGYDATFLQEIQHNQGAIFKISRAFSDARYDEEDIYQEIICELYKSWSSFEEKSKSLTWMRTVAVRTARKPFRGRRGDIVQYREELPEMEVEAIPDLEEKLIRLFRGLSSTNCAVLTLLLEGYTRKEVGQLLGITKLAVNMRLLRIKNVAVNQEFNDSQQAHRAKAKKEKSENKSKKEN